MPDPGGAPTIALRDVSNRPPVNRADAPYQLFLGTGLALALLGGFTLGMLLPIARALEWDWGSRWQELVQSHGQLQLVGFAGLFIAGMALRLMPRFAGRPLAYAALAPATVVLMGSGVALRSVAPFFDQRVPHDVAFAAAGVLMLAGSVAFSAMILGTLLHSESKAEATGWFFVLGTVAMVLAATANLLLTARAIDGGVRLLPPGENNALVSFQLYGVVLTFIGGVTTRAVATLAGHQRSQVAARLAATMLTMGAALYAAASLIGAVREPSASLNRLADASLLIISAALLLIVWASGIFHARANRVASASQRPFLFVRAACAWLVASSLLLGWYAALAFARAEALDQFEVDAVRHMITVGAVTMMIIGMAMLVVPEFAGRRLQHPREGGVVRSMFVAINLGAALRVWPAIEGVGWLSSTRYWPMATAGVLVLAVIAIFTWMFVQSYVEQRRPGWASPEALARRPGQTS